MRKLCCYAIIVGMATSCRTTPDVPSGVSGEGVNYMEISRSMGIVHLKTHMYLPGREGRSTEGSKYRCTDHHGKDITLIAHAPLRIPLQSYCRVVADALSYVSLRYPDRPVSIELHLVPHGIGFRSTRSSWRISTPRLSLVAPEFIEEQRTLANIVDLVAHETFHLAGALSRDELAESESAAYMTGLCAQLATLGSINVANLPGTQLLAKDEAIAESSRAAREVRDIVAPMMDGERIELKSHEGDRLMEICESRVTKHRD